MEPLAAGDPRQVGPYRLQARLGTGGLGRVYLGYSPGGRKVAVKVIRPELAGDQEFRARFEREVQAAIRVSSPYTAPVIDAGTTDASPWLATAYVDGPSLADAVVRSGPLPEAAVWQLAGDLVEALMAIHAEGLIPRALKPSNILLTDDGVRVIDFGISNPLADVRLTATGMIPGTSAFMSPEQVEGGGVGQASDVFSLGSVLVYAATGRPPFEGGSFAGILYRIMTGEPDLHQLAKGPPGLGLNALVTACLTKEPSLRPTLTQLSSTIARASSAFPPPAPGAFWPASLTQLIDSWEAAVALPPGPFWGVASSPPGAYQYSASPPYAVHRTWPVIGVGHFFLIIGNAFLIVGSSLQALFSLILKKLLLLFRLLAKVFVQESDLAVIRADPVTLRADCERFIENQIDRAYLTLGPPPGASSLRQGGQFDDERD